MCRAGGSRSRPRVPARDLRTRAEAELVADVLDVPLGGALGQEQPTSDLLVRQPLGDERGDLELAGRESHPCGHVAILRSASELAGIDTVLANAYRACVPPPYSARSH